MEVALIGICFILYLTIRYFVIDHDTQADKDRIRFAQGIRLVDLHQYDDAFSYFDEAVKAHPKSAIAFAYRAKCHLRNQNAYSALFDLTSALSLDNTIADAYLDKGIALFQLNLYGEAFKEFDKAVWYFRGQQPDAMRWRALSRMKLEQYSQAQKDLIRAIELGDENSAYLLKQPPFSDVIYS
ncbi:tetratricopeptide repeat protein [Larkinella insperata]|uniref:Tetratricopeptide repeat protein n=1 Tax=Larkinella insperata TaxID=332158 RepID=A0ABW3Q2D2_9BACT|nr:tetratricopeptide repeat protein [Larkinella insperata]